MLIEAYLLKIIFNNLIFLLNKSQIYFILRYHRYISTISLYVFLASSNFNNL